MVSLQEIRAITGGELRGDRLLAPAPGHSARDRGMSIRLSRTSRCGYVVHLFNGSRADALAAKDDINRVLGIPEWQAPRRELTAVERMQLRAERREAQRRDAAERERKRLRAVALWMEAVDPTGTLVDAYLNKRALVLSTAIAGNTIRFHARCPWLDDDTGEILRVPAMLALLRDIATDEPAGVIRTRLYPDATKAGRKVTGTAAAAAVKFDAADRVLVAGEGAESALSARQMGFGPTWGLGSSVEIDRLAPVPGVERLRLLQENDRTGTSQKAVERCATRWHRAGRAVEVITPSDTFNDMNDQLQAEACR